MSKRFWLAACLSATCLAERPAKLNRYLLWALLHTYAEFGVRRVNRDPVGAIRQPCSLSGSQEEILVKTRFVDTVAVAGNAPRARRYCMYQSHTSGTVAYLCTLTRRKVYNSILSAHLTHTPPVMLARTSTFSGECDASVHVLIVSDFIRLAIHLAVSPARDARSLHQAHALATGSLTLRRRGDRWSVHAQAPPCCPLARPRACRYGAMT